MYKASDRLYYRRQARFMASGLQFKIDDGLASAPELQTAGPSIDPEAVRAQCERILADPLFRQSRRCSDLLRFIVERTLDGQHECLKERVIGIELFGRSPDYITGQDATVRVAVSEVRKRLFRYFESSQHRNELHIELPAGKYVAEFTLPQESIEEPASVPEIVSLPAVKPTRKQYWFGKVTFAVAMAVVGLLAMTLWGIRHFPGASPVERFWSPLLQSNTPVLISMASPVGSGTPHSEAGRNSTSNGSETQLGAFISQLTDYPVAELRSANAISSFLANHGEKSVIRLAQTTSLSDLRSAPAVVLGSSLNQWSVQLGSGLRFQFQNLPHSGLRWIEDTNNPEKRDWGVDLTEPYKQVKSEYALITRKVDPTTGQWWIGIGGTSVLGTLGAQQMLLDTNAMSALLARLPKGWERKNLQIVVQFKMVDGSLGASQPVAIYSW